ncbi:MAG: glycosyltransferase family 9 protein, partial [Terriglobales bacterium]
MSETFLIVKLAAAGDVLLTTAMAAALRQTLPGCRIGWITTAYAAPLLEANPDLDDIFILPPARRIWAELRQWQRRYADATVLVAHRSDRLALLLRLAGWRRLIGWDNGRNWGLARSVRFELGDHRLQWQLDLLAAAGIVPIAPLAPRLRLRADELAAGERVWRGARGPRWVMAAGGASNPWSAMPNRVWARERFLELA